MEQTTPLHSIGRRKNINAQHEGEKCTYTTGKRSNL
jgi:hypothetical protein